MNSFQDRENKEEKMRIALNELVGLQRIGRIWENIRSISGKRYDLGELAGMERKGLEDSVENELLELYENRNRNICKHKKQEVQKCLKMFEQWLMENVNDKYRF